MTILLSAGTEMNALVWLGELGDETKVQIAEAGFSLEQVDASEGRFLVEWERVSKEYADSILEGRFKKSDGEKVYIGGEGSAGLGAFIAAWHRPDAFAGALVVNGHFESREGAEILPRWVDLAETKDLRLVFVEGGRRPVLLALMDSLGNAGYEFERFEIKRMGDALDALAVKVDNGIGNEFLRAVLIKGVEWELLGEGYRFSEGTAVNRQGVVFFNDIQASETFRIDRKGEIARIVEDNQMSLGQTFGADGDTLYSVSWGFDKLFRLKSNGTRDVFCTGLKGNDIVGHPDGSLYLTSPQAVNPLEPGRSRVWRISKEGEKRLLDEGLRFSNGLAFSPDYQWLYVNDWNSHWVYRYEVEADGSLSDKEQFIRLAKLDSYDGAGSDGMRVDTEGRIWVSSYLGIQIFSQEGRALGIVDPPAERISHFVFGGREFDTLYATSIKGVYSRKTNARGVNPWD